MKISIFYEPVSWPAMQDGFRGVLDALRETRFLLSPKKAKKDVYDAAL